MQREGEAHWKRGKIGKIKTTAVEENVKYWRCHSFQHGRAAVLHPAQVKVCECLGDGEKRDPFRGSHSSLCGDGSGCLRKMSFEDIYRENCGRLALYLQGV